MRDGAGIEFGVTATLFQVSSEWRRRAPNETEILLWAQSLRDREGELEGAMCPIKPETLPGL